MLLQLLQEISSVQKANTLQSLLLRGASLKHAFVVVYQREFTETSVFCVPMHIMVTSFSLQDSCMEIMASILNISAFALEIISVEH